MKKITRAEKTKGQEENMVKIGAGLLAAGAAAAAGYYFYASKDAKNHRKIAATWATDMQKEVIEETKHLKKVGPKEFASIVDRIAKTYLEIRAIDRTEMKRAVDELKSHWDKIPNDIQHRVRTSTPRAKVKKKISK